MNKEALCAVLCKHHQNKLNKQGTEKQGMVYICCYILLSKRGGKEGSKIIYSYLLIFIMKYCKIHKKLAKTG